MHPNAINRLLLPGLLAFTCTLAPKVSGTDETKSIAPGSVSPAQNDAPGGNTSNYSVMSPASRLGMQFDPATKEAEKTPVAPALPPEAILLPETVLLPPFVVWDAKVKLTEKDVMTDKATLKLAEKQCLSPLYLVTFGPLSQLAGYYFDWTSILNGWHPNKVEALVLYRQEELLKNQMEMDRLLKLEALNKPTEAKQQLQRLRSAKPADGWYIKIP